MRFHAPRHDTSLFAYDRLGNLNGPIVDDAATFGRAYDRFVTSIFTYDGTLGGSPLKAAGPIGGAAGLKSEPSSPLPLRV